MFEKIKSLKNKFNSYLNFKTQYTLSDSKIKICPKCTAELEFVNEQLNWLMPQKFNCKECNYEGSIYLEK